MSKTRKTKEPQSKHIFVTGGVVSSLGKGISAASIGVLLQHMGYKVAIQKLDPYLNVDPGTMNPFQHGEVFVTHDGAETDLDLGHYERFLNQPCNNHATYTSGRIYQEVLRKERKGDYHGGTVQVIPHITNEIKDALRTLVPGADVVIHELGGTVGDIEGLPFVEAVRQFMHEVGRDRAILCHLAYIPYIKAAGEMKTKPAQHSVQKLREIGLMPDFLLCRTEHKLNREIREKLSLFCNVPPEHVIELADAKHSIYEVPEIMLAQDVNKLVAKRLRLRKSKCELKKWKLMLRHIRRPKDELTIAMVGKYIDHQDAYKSVTEAIDHAGYGQRLKVNLVRLESDVLEKDEQWKRSFRGVHGIVVPGGFGSRGCEGKIRAVMHARVNKIPFLGLCLGLQMACVEFARNVLGWTDAHSLEMDPKTAHPVIVLMEAQKAVMQLGGTMRLGQYPCSLVQKGSHAARLYGQEQVRERHRHRYEFNNDYVPEFEAAGMQFTGLYIPDRKRLENSLVEIIELKDHPYFVGIQAHPEFLSSPINPHPLFAGLISAAYRRKRDGGRRKTQGA